MKLADKAEAILALLQAVDSEEWELEMTFRLSLDPITDMRSGIEGVFIVPVVNDYNLDESTKRRNIISINSTPRVAVTFARPFASKDSAGIDVSTWEEVKKVINFREQVELKIMKGMANIRAVDSEPPLETTFDKRWFLAMTEFHFHAIQC